MSHLRSQLLVTSTDYIRGSHEDVREMEYKLYQSKLKPLVNRTLIRNIIESSSTGEHPHHSVAMWLIVEKSIQERRERMLERAKNGSQSGSTPEPETSTEAPTDPIPQVKPPTPDPAPQSVSQSSSSSALASASATTEASADSSTLSEPREETKAGCLEEPPTYPLPDPSCNHRVYLPCRTCGRTTSLSGRRLFRRISYPGKKSLKCGSCGIECLHGTYACTKCRGGLEL